MTARKLIQTLQRRGVTLRSVNGRDLEVGPTDLLTDADREFLRNRKRELLQLLASPSRKPPAKGETLSIPPQKPLIVFRCGGEQTVAYQYRRGQGQVFRGRFALDCETEFIVGLEIPQLALVSVSDGKTHYIIHPDDVANFVLAHRKNTVVCHNVAFDYWVIHQHLADKKAVRALRAWTASARKGRFRDTMLLDMLLTVAAGQAAGEHIDRRDLAAVAEQYAGLKLNKNDQYRRRFDEIIGRDLTEVTPRFLKYAIKDPIATARAYGPMHAQAKEYLESVCPAESECQFKRLPDAVQKFGVLTEKIQVGAAIALAAVSRAGMHVDARQLVAIRGKYERLVLRLARSINQWYPGIFTLGDDGRFMLTPKSGEPRKSMCKVVECFLAAAAEIEANIGKTVEIPTTETGRVSTAAVSWRHLAGSHRFIDAWFNFTDAAKLNRFLRQLNGRLVHPQYNILTVTGRVSCSSPNIQQVPRNDEFRELIRPSPRHLLLAVDYKFVELVTLAAVCETRFGRSQLAEVIRKGIDPHCYTAAMLLGQDYQEFMHRKQGQPDEFKRWRQLAKPINFGVPGGMGAESLTEYARSNYGVEMSPDEAKRFHSRLVEEVYPELKLYLADTSMESLARNLGVDVGELWVQLDPRGGRSPAISGGVRKIVEGRPYKVDGTPYSEAYVAKVWAALNRLNTNPALTTALNQRSASTEFATQLFFTSVPTVTGRVRGGVTYTSERNTQFQGLAADGAKLALARLVLDGYRVVGFVHDEILIELPDEGGYVEREVVDSALKHIREGMEEVTCGIPVECEYTLATCWSKRAELIERGDKIYAWRPEAAK